MVKSSTCIEKGKINTFRSRKATRASVNYDSPVRPHSEQGPLPPCWQTEAPARYPGTRLSSHAHRIFGFISPLISGNFCLWLFSLLFIKCSDVALSGTHTSLLFITMPWADLLLQTAVSPIRWTHSSLLSAPHISRKISVPFLSPWSVYRLLPGRTWFHCAFNKDSAAPLVTALDLVTGLEWGRRPCSGRPRHRNPSADGKASENRGPERVVYTPGAGPKIARKWKQTPYLEWTGIKSPAQHLPARSTTNSQGLGISQNYEFHTTSRPTFYVSKKF